MKLLLVMSVDPWTRSVSTVHKYVAAGRALGHEVAVFGEPQADLPAVPFTTDLRGVDLALFVIQVERDFPDMPHLARLLDGVPRERRMVVDLWGRFNDTIRLEHDFNHLEKIEGHLGWEWEEAMLAASATITQPTLAPLRPNVGSFLFHGFDPGSVVKPYASAGEAAAAWLAAGPPEKPYGVMYVGSNWQRWEQVRRFLEGYGPVRDEVGQACLTGWDWAARPQWAVDNGILGIDTDPTLLARARRRGSRRRAVRRGGRPARQGAFRSGFPSPPFPSLGVRDEPDLRDILCRLSPGAHAAQGVRVGDLR